MRTVRLPLPISVACGLALATAGLVGTRAVRAQSVPLPLGQARYYESCGGCHGLGGTSARPQIPVLRSQVGAFMCSDEGRRYIVQLPNVSFAAMSDADLAATMNFVVFQLGGDSVPKHARRFTAGEIRTLRAKPLKNQPLAAMRDVILGRIATDCYD